MSPAVGHGLLLSFAVKDAATDAEFCIETVQTFPLTRLHGPAQPAKSWAESAGVAVMAIDSAAAGALFPTMALQPTVDPLVHEIEPALVEPVTVPRPLP